MAAKTAHIEFFTLCDYATTSKEGKLSIIGIFDRMFTRQLPSTFARFFIVAILKGEPDSEHQVTLSLTDPDGGDVMPAKQLKIKLGAQGRSNIITDVVNLPLKMAGDHRLQLTSDEKQLGSTTFTVTKITPQSGTQNLPN